MSRPLDRPERSRGISVRMKLTLSYAGLVVVAGCTLLTVGVLLLRFVPEGIVNTPGGGWAPNRSNLMEVFLRYAGWAFIGLVLFGLIGGWLLAGVVLRPVGQMTRVTRQVRDGLYETRIALSGRRDEFTELADAFDEMVSRVQRTIEEERRFAANASHELRTPHAIIRTMVEVAQANPDARDVDKVLSRVAVTNERASAIVESLLTLSRLGRGRSLALEPVDLAMTASWAVEGEQRNAADGRIRLHLAVEPVVIGGDRTLLEQLASNLVRNAVAYNLKGGSVWVSVRPTEAGAEFTVTNTGTPLDPALVATLTEPFVRGAGRARADGTEGSGLGLAVVESIVHAHVGTLHVSARTRGGLNVRVVLPAHLEH
jgi:two-component system sensor histidine kinase VanS